MTTILVVLLVLLLVGTLPNWPHSQGFGWAPSGIISAVLIVVLVLWLIGRL